MDKFAKVPVEDDTKILVQHVSRLGDYEVLYQKWFWDGITAESLIFANEDIASFEEQEITEYVAASPLLKEGSAVTFKRSDTGFTFVNFNFETE